MRSGLEEPHGLQLTALLFAGLLLGGCSSLGTKAPPPEAKVAAAPADEGHVRKVFVFQGRVANDLLERYEFADEPSSAPDPVLATAESRMTESCTYLNQAAVSYLEGSKPGWRLKMMVFATVDRCESAARTVAALLSQDNQRIASTDGAH